MIKVSYLYFIVQCICEIIHLYIEVYNQLSMNFNRFNSFCVEKSNDFAQSALGGYSDRELHC